MLIVLESAVDYSTKGVVLQVARTTGVRTSAWLVLWLVSCLLAVLRWGGVGSRAGWLSFSCVGVCPAPLACVCGSLGSSFRLVSFRWVSLVLCLGY